MEAGNELVGISGGGWATSATVEGALRADQITLGKPAHAAKRQVGAIANDSSARKFLGEERDVVVGASIRERWGGEGGKRASEPSLFMAGPIFAPVPEGSRSAPRSRGHGLPSWGSGSMDDKKRRDSSFSPAMYTAGRWGGTSRRQEKRIKLLTHGHRLRTRWDSCVVHP